jgi:hypothetical protein
VLSWRGTPSGEFTVRSAYHLEKEKIERLRGESSRGTGCSRIWKAIWSLHIPNSVKMFLWRACHDIIPTRVNLQKKGIALDPSCIFCNMEAETTMHILWNCPSSNDVWGACAKRWQKCTKGGDSFLDLMEELIDKCKEEELEFLPLLYEVSGLGEIKWSMGGFYAPKYPYPGGYQGTS